MSRAELPVAVLGAGLAGLVAARELRRNGVDVKVYEAGPKIAGLAGTERDADGFTFDFGAHFITNRLASAIGIGHDCRIVHHYGEAVRVNDRYYGYPNGLMSVPRYVGSALRARANRGAPRTNAAEWFRAEYGRALADEVAIPLLEAWSGAPADQLAASVGDKIPSSIVHTVALSALSKATNTAIAIGYSSSQPMTAHVWHVYPNDGVATVCDALAAPLADAISLSSPVERVLVADEQVRAVVVDGHEVPVRAVVSTAPVNVLARLVEGTDRLAHFARFRYRPMVLVNLKLIGRGLLPDVITWLPHGFPFFRLTEATLSMPWLAPEGRTTVLCDIGAAVGDAHWSMDDEALGRYCVEHLAPLIPGVAHRYLGCRVMRTPVAYPVYLNEYEDERLALLRSTGVDGLLSVGRNGEFSHDLMEDVYWRTMDAVHRWLVDAGRGHTASFAPV
jgi:oxygen-dependent protoporphyrinogen oxidase